MQVFFATRSAMRSASFGSKVDNGTASEKRWAREVNVTAQNNTQAVMQGQGRYDKREKKIVPVTVKKSRKIH